MSQTNKISFWNQNFEQKQHWKLHRFQKTNICEGKVNGLIYFFDRISLLSFFYVVKQYISKLLR